MTNCTGALGNLTFPVGLDQNAQFNGQDYPVQVPITAAATVATVSYGDDEGIYWQFTQTW